MVASRYNAENIAHILHTQKNMVPSLYNVQTFILVFVNVHINVHKMVHNNATNSVQSLCHGKLLYKCCSYHLIRKYQ